MLDRTFDSRKAYRAVIYARMSSDKQNKRSPDQQIKEIKELLKRLRLKWQIVREYRDDGKSGRYLRKRLGYQQMLQDIKTGKFEIDLILVDTIERFGRVEELPVIRKELFDKCGILVLSGDTNFCDPLTPQGKAMSMVESMRATEDGRIKAHNVRRGKRDAGERKYWPGGPRPFGLRFRSVMVERNGKMEVEGNHLEPEPSEAWIIRLAFAKAHGSGFGQNRLAEFLNEHPDIPEEFKPFHPATVGAWLKNAIYKGVLIWDKNSTGIIDDVRVIKRNVEDKLLIVPDFCEPIVDPEIWEAVNAVRGARADRIRDARDRKHPKCAKQIAPPAPGLTLKYMLTGLVCCGHCGRSMVPSSGSEYVTKNGETKRYVTYVCPAYNAGICPNQIRIPEDWLRQKVVELIRNRLFLTSA